MTFSTSVYGLLKILKFDSIALFQMLSSRIKALK